MSPSSDARRSITIEDISPSQRQVVARYDDWMKFRSGPRLQGGPLLKSLPRYPDCVMVAGCQRSGTTMLTRLIAGSANFWRLNLTRDDELDAGLVLSGNVDLPERGGRYCFQTTYLNSSYPEYRTIGPRQRLIWVLRNPSSVVYSMVFNWRRWGLNELYADCGVTLARTARQRRVRIPWPLGPSRAEKACMSYAAKTSQLLEIREFVPAEQLLIVDYDDLVLHPDLWLTRVFEFIGERFDPGSVGAVRSDSVAKARKLSKGIRRQVDKYSVPAYENCLRVLRA